MNLKCLWAKEIMLIRIINVKKIKEVQRFKISPEQKIFKTYLVIHSIRNKNAGNCFDHDILSNHILQPGKNYEIKVIVSNQDESFESEIISITTNILPFDGSCQVLNENDLVIMESFNINCSGWISSNNNDTLMYNALFKDVPMNNEYSLDQNQSSRSFPYNPPGKELDFLLPTVFE